MNYVGKTCSSKDMLSILYWIESCSDDCYVRMKPVIGLVSTASV